MGVACLVLMRAFVRQVRENRWRAQRSAAPGQSGWPSWAHRRLRREWPSPGPHPPTASHSPHTHTPHARAQILDTLCVLHEARIIHCDLKPENVLVQNADTGTAAR